MGLRLQTSSGAAPKPLVAPLKNALLQRKCACASKPGAGGEWKEDLHRKAGNPETRSGKDFEAPPVVHEVLRSPGQPIDPSTRAFMEPRFRHDFSQVRVHTDAKSAESAHAVNALAYTVDHHLVFGAGRYAPGTNDGRMLLAHELTHVLQQKGSWAPRQTHGTGINVTGNGAAEREADFVADALTAGRPLAVPLVSFPPAVARKTDPDPEGPRTAENPPADDNKISPSAEAEPPPQLGTDPGAALAATPGRGGSNPPGLAQCPDPPGRNWVVIGCTRAPSPAPVAVETAVLPVPDPARFGGDADRARFAKELAHCRAAREVKEEIESRYRKEIATAKQRTAEESKAASAAAIRAATEGLDPKDKGAINRARAQAGVEAKRAAVKKLADAQAAVTRQDVAAVTSELSAKYEDELAADYEDTIRGALARMGPGWLRVMQARLKSERKRIAREKAARPKSQKGEAPPPVKSADEITAEVEAEMVEVRCTQEEWGRNQLEGVSFAWAVGRREQVDFRTIPQKAGYLQAFKPAYVAPANDRVEIPTALQQDKNMPGVAPEVADFLSRMAVDPGTPDFSASNYSGHGGGPWAGKGFSVDLFLKAARDSRGFWQHSVAVRFLLALDATAKALGARWRVLYNDFGVAQEVNQATGSRNVEFMGDSRGGNLNWHGPDPLILHFHLDLEIAKQQPPAGTQP
jgi:hypothetical protein